ncbi:MAG: lipoyl(octanoyl) transferase LipB [Methylophilaceae bacterium]|nr:lipoyl(octanoyl) transferase LipB [Methylophilaceae bacterium]
MPQNIRVRRLGLTDYETTWRAMQTFTATRNESTLDELWLTEHPPVYTLGLNRQNVRLPDRAEIPLVMADRGGKITYHGPGQVVIYVLIDLKRKELGLRQLVSGLEHMVISLLAKSGVTALTRAGAPGVYVENCKIASLGLRLKNHCCYHGLALNIDMDLSPFQAIDPCGYQGLQITQTRSLGLNLSAQEAGDVLLGKFMKIFDYTENPV